MSGTLEDDLAEYRRLALLAELGVLDTAPEPGFDALTDAAAAVTDCPIAFVSLVDRDRAWFKARRGIDLTHSPRQWSFCAHALQVHDLMEVGDASRDPRFADNPFVVGTPFVRFYAGHPLVVDGIVIGTLCVVDTRPRGLTDHARDAMRGLAGAAAALLGERRGRVASFEQQRRLTDFAMMSGDWLWETDAAHRVSWLCCAYAAQPSLPEPWQLDRTMADTRLLDSAGHALAPPTTLHQLLDQRRAFARAMICFEAPGGPFYLLLSAMCRRHDDGSWCGYRGIARDLRARVAAEQARIHAADVLAELSAQVPGLIFQFQLAPDGRMAFPYVSERISDLQLSAAEVAVDAGPALARCHPDDADRLLQSIHRSAAQLTTWRETFRMRLPPRGERLMSGHAQPKRLDDGAVLWHGMLTDVTEQFAEAERVKLLSDAQAAAERSTQLRGEFMSRVSHELRTPLNAILGFAQLLRLSGSAPAGAADTQQAARQIETAGAHLLSLVNDMLDLSSLDAGRMNLQLRPLAVGPLVQRCLVLVEPHARQTGMSIETASDPAAPSVLADARAVRQIVFNLVGNAIKFGGADTAVHVGVRHLVDEATVAVDVTDAGPGIAPGDLPLLFKPFTRIAVGGGGAPVGSGLGLSISRQLALAMGGRIDVDSLPGRGTTFTLRLPVDGRAAPDGPDDDAAFDAPRALDVAVPIGPATVLYIEDEPVNALLMQEFFRSMPGSALRLVVAATAQDGVAQAGRLLPELVLLDMHLPDGDGFGVLATLRADPRTAPIPVIGLSADALPQQVQRARQAGFAEYWTKPVDFRQVHADLLRRFPGRD